jgi:deazaflavin-dependent oxidoreductase (nitroreductase family)
MNAAAEVITMTTAISRKVPPQRLINLTNPVVRAALRSPLHRFVDDALLILHVTGRRTGHRYDIPVGYLDVDGAFVVVTQHRWRANLRDATAVDVTHGGRRQRMHAHLDEQPASVAAVLHAAGERAGWRAAQRQTGLRSNLGRPPTTSELEQAAREYHLATITLTVL